MKFPREGTGCLGEAINGTVNGFALVMSWPRQRINSRRRRKGKGKWGAGGTDGGGGGEKERKNVSTD